MQRAPGEETPLENYLRDTGYIGARVTVEDASAYRYLVFYEKRTALHGQPSVYVYDKNGNVVDACQGYYGDLDGEWKRYILNISHLNGPMTVIFNGGYTDNTGSPESTYIFSSAALY